MTADLPPDGAAARAEALLAATNRFIAAADLDDLGGAVMDAATSIFGAWKASLIVVDPEGRATVAGLAGFTAAERDRVEATVATGNAFMDRVGAGVEFWSDIAHPLTDDGRARLARYEAGSGFSLPMRSPAGIRGIFSVLYADERRFDPPTRQAARTFAGQVGLAVELVVARDDLRRQTSITRSLFEIGQRLATVTSIDDVPAALASAIRATTGAGMSLVGRWLPDEGRVRFEAVEGVPPALRQRILELDARPDRYAMIRGGIEGRANVRVAPFDPGDVPLELVSALELTAIAGAPILIGERTWGVIAVATRAGEPSIVERGVELLAGLAAIAATAIGRAEAVSAVERQADLLEATVDQRTMELRQAVDELVVASKARTEFLASVSHELRTPLTAILGFTTLLMEGHDGPLNAEQRSDVETIDQSGRRLLELIDDLIDISRIEAGRVELNPGPLDVRSVVEETVARVRARAGEKGLSLRVSVPDEAVVVMADGDRVRDILLNLLSNAVKFTPAGGIVRVALAEQPGEVRLVVEDTGIGIAADQQSHVFDKFHRVAGPEYPGTGLGLAIAREYARLHGGEIALESALGLGSRFTVVLPREPA